MIKLMVCIIAALTVLPLDTIAQGYPPTYREPNGRTWTCYAPHNYTRQRVPVAGINGNAGGFWGLATYNPWGWPMIIFDVNILPRLPAIVKRLVYYHECAHLSLPTLDEVRANCEGLRRMRGNGDISPSQEDELRNIFYSLGSLPPQYGGSGKVFWDNTMRCMDSG